MAEHVVADPFVPQGRQERGSIVEAIEHVTKSIDTVYSSNAKHKYNGKT